MAAGVLLALASFAAVLDVVGPPAADDPSALRPLVVDGESFVLPEANEGAFEGGDPATNGPAESDVTSVQVPTGGKPSPLFGARPFEQQMLLFEEFGPQKLATAPPGTVPFPTPETGPAPYQDPDDVAASGPSPDALDAFIRDPGLYVSSH